MSRSYRELDHMDAIAGADRLPSGTDAVREFKRGLGIEVDRVVDNRNRQDDLPRRRRRAAGKWRQPPMLGTVARNLGEI